MLLAQDNVVGSSGSEGVASRYWTLPEKQSRVLSALRFDTVALRWGLDALRDWFIINEISGSSTNWITPVTPADNRGFPGSKIDYSCDIAYAQVVSMKRPCSFG
jgi:hypothetical protein